MKYAVLVLALAVASHAAFTRDLVGEHQFAVRSIGWTVENTVAATNRASDVPSKALQKVFEAFSQQLQNQLNNVLAGIQNGLQPVAQLQQQLEAVHQQAAIDLSLGAPKSEVSSRVLNRFDALLPFTDVQPANRGLLETLLAGALGVPVATVESIMGTLKWLMGIYTSLKPFLDALNIPVLLQGALQSLINSDYMQWLIYEVAPAQLPQSAIDALNNFLGTYFGPTRIGAGPEEKDLADYLGGLYQNLLAALEPQIAALHAQLQQYIQDAQHQAVQTFQQILEQLQSLFVGTEAEPLFAQLVNQMQI